MGSHHNVLCLLVGILLLITIINPSIAVFVNVDCGSKASYTDELSLEWTGDDGYVQNGEPKEVFFTYIPPYVSGTVMTTLRAFPTLRKNCYTINVDKSEKVIVRASFFYGNYDGKNSPPTFELQFDGNFWTTVNTSSPEYHIYEVIYVTKANTTSICRAQTLRGHIPFMSALELRSLDSNMYSRVDPKHAFFLAYRANSGTNATIRYPGDVYDRIWKGEWYYGYADNERSEAVLIDVSKAEDKPPPAVLQDAGVGTLWGVSGRTIIYLSTENLPDTSVPVYITAYFSEVALLKANNKRSIDIYINDVPYSRQIIPPFGGVSVSYITNTTAYSNTNISIRGSDDSTLPPLINAYEVYSISDALTDGTNANDVNGLAVLKNKFSILQKWSGDPCLPSPFSWEWLECNSDASPQVKSLNLSSFGLEGALPDFSSLTALEIIDLHNNNLDGVIPNFLGSLPKLKLLNLADNRFSGTIPVSLSSKKNLILIATGNCINGKSCEQETSQKPPSTPSDTFSPPPPSAPSDTFSPPLPSSDTFLLPPPKYTFSSQLPSDTFLPQPPPLHTFEIPNGGEQSPELSFKLIIVFHVSLLLLLLGKS